MILRWNSSRKYAPWKSTPLPNKRIARKVTLVGLGFWQLSMHPLCILLKRADIRVTKDQSWDVVRCVLAPGLSCQSPCAKLRQNRLSSADLHQTMFQARKRNPNPNFWVRIFSVWVGVFHVNGWGPKSSVCPSKPGKSNFFAGISRRYPKSLRKKSLCSILVP